MPSISHSIHPTELLSWIWQPVTACKYFSWKFIFPGASPAREDRGRETRAELWRVIRLNVDYSTACSCLPLFLRSCYALFLGNEYSCPSWIFISFLRAFQPSSSFVLRSTVRGQINRLLLVKKKTVYLS